MNEPTTSTTGGRGRITARMIAAIGFLVAGIVGAYLDWIWWPVYSGLMITLAAGAIVSVGGIVALIGRVIGRRIVRRIALVVLAVGVGLVAGQNFGPSREPLISQPGGRMTLRLESPAVGVATGPADCMNVASATEFSVSGDPNMRLDTADRPFVSIYVNAGNRWQVLRDAPRKDAVLLNIGITAALVPDKGFPSTVGMQATESSTLKSTFSNEGGSIRFAHLAAQSGPDFNGQSMDLAGTLEWVCGAAPNLTPAADCVNPPPDIAALSDQTDPVACYGNAPLTLDAHLIPVAVDYMVSVEPAWLGSPSAELMLVGETRKVGAPALLVAVDPASGVSLSALVYTNVRITGHYDDPASQTCRETGRSSAIGGTPEPAAGTIERCRRTFVMTQVVPLQP